MFFKFFKKKAKRKKKGPYERYAVPLSVFPEFILYIANQAYYQPFRFIFNLISFILVLILVLNVADSFSKWFTENYYEKIMPKAILKQVEEEEKMKKN